MIPRHRAVPLVLAAAMSLCTGPDRDVAGVETTNGNTVTARVTGTSLRIEAPCDCIAGLFDTAYSPFDTLPPYTDSAAASSCSEAVFEEAPAGCYNAILWCPSGLQAFLPGLSLADGADSIASVQLSEPGRIEAPLLTRDSTILVHLRGTPFRTVARSGLAVLDSVPAGNHRLHGQAGTAGGSVGLHQPGPGAPATAELTLPPGGTIVLDTLVVQN